VKPRVNFIALLCFLTRSIFKLSFKPDSLYNDKLQSCDCGESNYGESSYGEFYWRRRTNPTGGLWELAAGFADIGLAVL
jgi:hypothetical protein